MVREVWSDCSKIVILVRLVACSGGIILVQLEIKQRYI